MFRHAGVACPSGSDHLRDAWDVAAALSALKQEQPSLRRAVVKLNEGFSGDGNAVFSFDEAPGTVTSRDGLPIVCLRICASTSSSDSGSA